MFKVSGHGRLTNDPVTSTYGDNKTLIKFGFATKSSRKKLDGKYEPDFHNCIYFGNQSNLITSKGQELIIFGRLENNNWVDKDGSKHKDNQIIVESFELCGIAPKPAAPDPSTYQEPPEITIDDLPF